MNKQKEAFDLLGRNQRWMKSEGDYYQVVYFTKQWVILKKEGKEKEVAWRLDNGAERHFLDNFCVVSKMKE